MPDLDDGEASPVGIEEGSQGADDDPPGRELDLTPRTAARERWPHTRTLSGPTTQRIVPEQLIRLAGEVGQPLIAGTRLRCPACESEADILAYTPMKVSKKYEDQVVVPLKCPREECRHIFALRPNGREEGL